MRAKVQRQRLFLFSTRSTHYFLLSWDAAESGMTFSFEKLLVYQKAVDFADRICGMTEQFPRGYGFLVDQLNLLNSIPESDHLSPVEECHDWQESSAVPHPVALKCRRAVDSTLGTSAWL